MLTTGLWGAMSDEVSFSSIVTGSRNAIFGCDSWASRSVMSAGHHGFVAL